MPTGEPNKQTQASEKYHARIGLMSKSYKLKRDLVEAFNAACKENGVSQSLALTRLMTEYIDKTNKKAE